MKTFNYVQGLPTIPPLKQINSPDGRMYETEDGKKYPSVTTVLSHFKKKKLNEWRNRVGHDEAQAITNRAATRGTKFHNIMEQYLSNDFTNLKDHMPDMIQAFRDVQPIIDRIDNIHHVETSLHSKVLRLAGKTDVIAEFDGKLSIIDFKTSLREKKESWIIEYFQQGTAYGEMYEELTGLKVEQIVIIISVDHSEPQLFIKNPKIYLDSLKEKVYAYHQLHNNKEN